MLLQPLNIDATKTSPSIKFDAVNKVCLIKGRSMMEDAAVFYFDVIEWLEQFEQVLDNNIGLVQAPQVFQFVFQLEYFNTSSGKFLFEMVEIIDRVYRNIQNYNFNNEPEAAFDVQIDWHYQEDDEFMKTVGREMQDITELKFQFAKVG